MGVRAMHRKTNVCCFFAVIICLVPGFFAGDSTAIAGLIYNASADFDAGYDGGNNPNGVWTYGWSSALDSELVKYTERVEQRPGQHGWYDPTHEWSQSPQVSRNVGDLIDDGNVYMPAGALLMYGVGPNGTDFSHVVFTAPASGDYALSSEFIGRQAGVYGGVHILVNGTSILDTSIEFLGDTKTHTTLLSLASNDTVDFALQGFGSSTPNWTELRATLTAVPEPGSFVLVGIGGTSVLAIRVLRRGRKEVTGRV